MKEAIIISPLSKEEADVLTQLETQIQTHLYSHNEAMKVISQMPDEYLTGLSEVTRLTQEIKKHKLYRAYGTYEEYLQSRFPSIFSVYKKLRLASPQRMSQMLAAAQVMENLKDQNAEVMPQNEHVLRQIGRVVGKEAQAEVWQEALVVSEEWGEDAPTGKTVETAMVRLKKIDGLVRNAGRPGTSSALAIPTYERAFGWTEDVYYDAMREELVFTVVRPEIKPCGKFPNGLKQSRVRHQRIRGSVLEALGFTLPCKPSLPDAFSQASWEDDDDDESED